MHPALTATAIFLIACSLGACAIPVRIDADCAWTKPIRFSEATKMWLVNQVPWPAPVRADLIKIAKHNEKYGVFCG